MPVTISFRDVSHPNLLQEFSCEIEAGSTVLCITSREEESSALTRLITGMTRPELGSVLINGQDLAGLEQAELCQLRQQIAVVPSKGGLVSNLKFWENITLPLVYHNGGVTAEEEQKGLAYLERLEYTGRLMALPAHLTPYDRRVAVLVRAFLQQPRIILYCNCLDGITADARTAFSHAAIEFHAAAAERTSLYFTSSPELATLLQADRIIRLNEFAETVRGHHDS